MYVGHQQKFQNLVLVGSLCKGYASKISKYKIFTYLASFAVPVGILHDNCKKTNYLVLSLQSAISYCKAIAHRSRLVIEYHFDWVL